jgi:hypothetical protein
LYWQGPTGAQLDRTTQGPKNPTSAGSQLSHQVNPSPAHLDASTPAQGPAGRSTVTPDTYKTQSSSSYTLPARTRDNRSKTQYFSFSSQSSERARSTPSNMIVTNRILILHPQSFNFKNTANLNIDTTTPIFFLLPDDCHSRCPLVQFGLNLRHPNSLGQCAPNVFSSPPTHVIHINSSATKIYSL